MNARMTGPNHLGLGLGFGLGGGWYRRRLDFDLGMAARCYPPAGRSVRVCSAADSTAVRENGSGWYSPFDHIGRRSRKWGEAGCPDCPVVCTPTDASISERSMTWRHDGTTSASEPRPGYHI